MKVFAHRGISALHPENSQSAVKACKGESFYGIEVDLFQVGANFFLMHDPWLSRVFGINKKVTSTTEHELNQLICPDAKPIPDLEWLISELSDQSLMLNIEIKEIKDIDLFIDRLATLLEEYSFAAQNLLISSFNHIYLKHISERKPDWQLGLLLAHHPLDIQPYLELMPIHSIHLSIEVISAELIRAAKQQKLQVFVYTVDQVIDIEFLYENNVDGIFANHPAQAYKIINNLI